MENNLITDTLEAPEFFWGYHGSWGLKYCVTAANAVKQESYQ